MSCDVHSCTHRLRPCNSPQNFFFRSQVQIGAVNRMKLKSKSWLASVTETKFAGFPPSRRGPEPVFANPGIDYSKASIPPPTCWRIGYRIGPPGNIGLAESIPWNRLLGSINVYKYGLCIGFDEYLRMKLRFQFPYLTPIVNCL
jgi:hypothetical protein